MNKFKYLVTHEEFGSNGDYHPCWEDKEWDCETYEELIKEYTKIYLNTIINPKFYRGVQCYKLEPVELLPDTPEVEIEMMRLKQARIDAINAKAELDRKIIADRKIQMEEYDKKEYERLKEKYGK